MWGKKRAENFHSILKKREQGEPVECNDGEFKSLLLLRDKISQLINNDQPADQAFKESLQAKLLQARRADKHSMKTRLFETLLPNRLVGGFYATVAAVLLIALLANTFFPWLQPGKPDLFSGFSKLIISPANAMDNFELKPLESDSLGATASSGYVLKSKEPVDLKLIKENLTVSPAIEYDIREVSPTEWQILPKRPLKANEIFKVRLATTYLDGQGEEQSRDYGWAYQIKDSFRILHTIPRDRGAEVPVDTGIEITFSHDNFVNFANYFSIEPKTDGRFEQHGRTMVFVPGKRLEEATIYKVTVKAGLPLSGSDETLAEDKVINFSTAATSKNQGASFYVYKDLVQASSQEKPVIEMYHPDANAQVETKVYRIPTADDYLARLKDRNRLPGWSYAKDEYFNYSGLKQVAAFTGNVRQGKTIYFLEFPDKLPVGYYVASFKVGEVKNQALLQVTDLSAYFSLAKRRSVVWVNDLATKRPVAGAEVELVGQNATAVTDNSGIAVFDTPQSPLESQEGKYYLKITAGKANLILSDGGRPYGWDDWVYSEGMSDMTQADYWYYLYKDRPLYQNTDSIKFWGILKDRSGQAITKKVMVSLEGSGYVDYYYRPTAVVEKEVALDSFGGFEGSLDFKNMKAGYYTLTLKAGDTVIQYNYLQIMNYTKPAFNITLTADKNAVMAGETVNLVGQASFFDGTPVPNLDLKYNLGYSMDDGKDRVTNVRTDAEGKVKLTFKQDYIPCVRFDSYQCWPKYNWLSLTPEAAELSEIYGTQSVHVYGPKVAVSQNVDYPATGEAAITFTSRQIILPLVGDKEGPVAAGTRITGDLVKVTYNRRVVGTYYDYINKRTVENVDYDRREEPAGTFNGVTDASGRFVLRQKVEPGTSYDVKYKYVDGDGKFDLGRTYLYYFDKGITMYDAWSGGIDYYSLSLDKPAYAIGEQVQTKVRLNDRDLSAGANSRYLYLKYQNGLKDAEPSAEPTRSFAFGKQDVPNANLMAVYFNGRNYFPTSFASASYDTKGSEMSLTVKSDKERYQPGQTAKLSIVTKDKQGKPLSAEVSLSLVDEAIFALSGEEADPLAAIYRGLNPGELARSISHEHQPDGTQAEGGGCFLAGTLITMADGSTKSIEAVQTGDKVKTFDNPLTRQPAQGEVTKTFQHLVRHYLIINGKMRLTPEHLVYSNLNFRRADELAVGDWLLDVSGSMVAVVSIEHRQELAQVFNLRVDPQHTFFADGFYVHNSKGDGPRQLFIDTPMFKSVQTDGQGKATVEVKLPDNITSWRLTSQAASQDMQVGASKTMIPVSLPAFVNVSVNREYLSADRPKLRLRAYGTALTADDKTEFSVEIDSKLAGDSMTTTAFKPADFPLPILNEGLHSLIYRLKSAKGDDAVKLPLSITPSRLTFDKSVTQDLTTDTRLEPDSEQPIEIILSDRSQGRFYSPLSELTWSWGDRVDQALARKQARELLNRYFQEDIAVPLFRGERYEDPESGLTLLPYSSGDLELTARLAAVAAGEFDETSLKNYFFDILEGAERTQEQVSLALYGLACLHEPVLPRLAVWLEAGGDKLSVKERLYLALAAQELGADEWARDMYFSVIGKSAMAKDNEIMIKVSERKEDNEQATGLAAVLAAALNAPERDGLWNFVENNYSQEYLPNLEKLAFIKKALPNLRTNETRIKLFAAGEEKTVSLNKGRTYSFIVQPEEAAGLKFLEVTGQAGITTVRRAVFDFKTAKKDPTLELRREYLVDGKAATKIKETDTVEIRLYPRFDSQASKGNYQLVEYLPSGLMPISPMRAYQYSYYYQPSSCSSWWPDSIDGQKITFSLSKEGWVAFSRRCPQPYFSLLARPKTLGSYKAEPAILQSYLNTDNLTFTGEQMIEIQ